MASLRSRPALPKYYQISQAIIARIQSGSLAVGAKVPSENEIIQTYGVSNTTARRALAEIESAGWARRIKGRGTYVCRSSVDRTIGRILSFTRSMLEAGRTPATRLLGVQIQPAGHSVAIQGRRYTLKGPLCRIQRLRLADGVPMMNETRYISVRLCPGIEKQNLEASLYELYERQYGLQLERVSQMLSCLMLDPEQTKAFGLEQAVPAFHVEGVTFCGKELIVEMEESIYRGDMYRFLVEAT